MGPHTAATLLVTVRDTPGRLHNDVLCPALRCRSDPGRQRQDDGHRYSPGMGLRAWSNHVDQRAQERWRRPYVAPAYLGLALAFAVYGLVASSVLPLMFAVVLGLMGTVAWLARRQDRR